MERSGQRRLRQAGAGLAVVMLCGCSGIPGFFTPSPDAFLIRTTPPLTAPAELFLRPPRSAAAGPEGGGPTAADILYESGQGPEGRRALSAGEQQLLRDLEAGRRLKNIRTLIDREARRIERLGEALTRALLEPAAQSDG